jgi:hypothetical protein
MRRFFRSCRTLCVGLIFAGAAAPTLLAASLPAGLVAAALATQGQYSTIKGRLVWGGSDIPAAKALVEKGKATKDPNICALEEPIPNRELVVDPTSKGVAYGLVYLVRPSGSNPAAVKELLAKNPKAELDQKNCEFLPYVQAIHQDQILVIKSSDAVSHNVRYAAFTNPTINQILAPRGQIEVKLTAERRPIVFACDVHAWMKAYLMVFDHPFFAVTGPDGSFEIKGVPGGSQNLVVWQEKVGYVNPEKAKGTPLLVRAGEVHDVGAVTIQPSQVK